MAVDKRYITQMIPIENIIIEDRIRKDLGDIEKLADSINEIGLLNPITVHRIEGGYQLLAGNRRIHACKGLGWKEIPARILNSPAGSFKYIPCEICDYLVTEEHHIIPQSMGGLDLEENTMFVCPNHHNLLDWMIKILIYLSVDDDTPKWKRKKYIEMLHKLSVADPVGIAYFERIIVPRIAHIIKLDGGRRFDEKGYTIHGSEYEALIQIVEERGLL